MDHTTPVYFDVRGRKCTTLGEAIDFAITLGGSPTIMESVRDEDGEGRSWGRVYTLQWVNDAGYDRQEYREVPQDYN